MNRAVRVYAFVLILLVPLCLIREIEAEEVHVRVHEGKVHLDVRNRSLSEVLQALAMQAGFVIKGAEGTNRSISFKAESMPVDELVRKLLNLENYVLVYTKNEWVNGELETVVILGTRAGPVPADNEGVLGQFIDGVWTDVPIALPQPALSSSRGEPEDPIRRVERAVVMQGFSNWEKVFSECRGEPVASQDPALRLTRLPESSPLRLLGLNEGDLVTDVNGKRVASLEDLAVGLAEGLQGSNSTLRIERRTPEGTSDPVYTELY